METKDIIVAPDFFNLIKHDIDEIIKDMDLEIGEDIDERLHLYSIKESLFRSDKSKDIVENKIFAGRTSIKWYEIRVDENNIDKIIEKIESEDNYYNKIAQINASELEGAKVYSCIKLGEGTYIMRIFVPSGSKTINNGIRVEKIPSISNTVMVINLVNKYVEVRASGRNAKRIFDCICKPLFGDTIVDVDVLGRYGGCLEKFRDSLNDGKFIDVKSIPDLNISLTREQNELLVSTLEALDEYYIDKDVEKLKERLSGEELVADEIPFTQLFLAGLAGIGLTMRDEFEEDLSDQSLYGVLKSYMTNQEGFIKFKLVDDDQEVDINNTIQVGVKTNSISFKSFSTEKSIEYIRRKILGY